MTGGPIENEDASSSPTPSEMTYEEMVTGARRGDPTAKRLYCQYLAWLESCIPRLKQVVTTKLRDRGRRWASVSDVVQSAVASFLGKHAVAVNSQSENSLLSKLIEIALRHADKWKKRYDRHRTPQFGHVDDSCGVVGAPLADVHESSADALFDAVENILNKLPPSDCAIGEAVIQGSADAEIAAGFGVSLYKVQKVRRAIRDWIERELDSDEFGS